LVRICSAVAVQTKVVHLALCVEVLLDLGDEIWDEEEHSTAQGFVGEFAEEPLDQIQPGRGGGGEMQVTSRLPEPLRVLVS
jgi:hypothetical protein